jgi:hypothetical protein
VKIAFITSSLEPGQDGVGDYSRRLAAECIRQGHPSVIVSLNDANVSEAKMESQVFEGLSISVLRLPGTVPWNIRTKLAREWLDAFNPSWLSLQFVAFGFHRKGLCFGLGKRLAAMNSKASWHIMFHELWLGLGENAPFKHRVWGLLQRSIIRDILRRLRPLIVHTQAEPYRQVLSRENITATILPLFSNVPFIQGDGWGLLEPLASIVLGRRADRTKLYLAGIFGAVHSEWSAEQAVNILTPLMQRFQKRLVLVLIGRNNLTAEAITRLQLALHKQADIIVAGERNSLEISKILQALDLGLATTPRQVIQKSGSAAALLEHGLPVLITRDDWRLREAGAQRAEASTRLLYPEQFVTLKTLPGRDLGALENNSARKVASRLLTSMDLSLSNPKPTPLTDN